MSQPSVSRQHADWLGLVPSSGPFVSLPVLMRAFPQGLDARDPVQAKALREAFEERQDNPAAAGKQRAWLLHVLTALLGYPSNQVVEGQALPAGLEARMPEMGETLRPDLALIGPPGADSAGLAQMLIASYPAEQALDKPVTGRHWKATPATRMMELLHGAGVPLGLVTNGEQWMLVYAPRGEVTGYASWYASLWLDEPITLRAFHSLLGVRRFFGVAADGTLQALLKESASDQQEVTDQLGYQVREAVEVLVQSFDALDKESNRTLLNGVSPSSQYDAALTVMMRLVFLFSAEERGLLHLGKPLYDDNYAVSTLQEQLQEAADQHGEEVLERRSDAWARLLASFRAVHGGIRHQDLLMQAYGGSLFDPDRYAFLEGRAAGSLWRGTAADPLAVNNRVVLHLLNSLQRLRIKGGAGGGTETRRVSFRALGVEQIGHVYEGLLDHTAVRATETVLGLKGTRNKEPEIALAKLESLLAQGQDQLIDFLKDETGRSATALRRTLGEGGLLDEHRLRVACDHDESLQARLQPFAGFIRGDSFDRPLVVLAGSVFVTAGSTRRSTGAHYTPPSLTEPIVQHTLEPLVYVGPAEGLPRDQWKLRSPKEILALKVCDMAMGSGAFLVQVCRYLAERLTEAWENEESSHPGEVLITPDGEFSKGNPSERLVPSEANERIAIARRVVADRCLYGVDINPMAVEMAKLSLWLITVDAHRPFTFLDHALKCGDSLLGITSIEQLETFSLRPGGGKQQAFGTINLRRHIDEARRKREALESMPSDTPEQIAIKAALWADSEDSVAKLNSAADVLVSMELKALKGKAYETDRDVGAEEMMLHWAQDVVELRNYAEQHLNGRHCLHWELVFPEVMERDGFDAFVGNPPFIGGRKMRQTLGGDYLKFLTEGLFPSSSGNADLCAFFFRRAFSLLRPNGVFGLLATNTIAQGDTRDAGLAPIVSNGGVIVRGMSSAPWPGQAGVFVAEVWVRSGAWEGKYFLDDVYVAGISSNLSEDVGGDRNPFRLMENAEKSFQGSIILGAGFVLNSRQAASLIEKCERNREVIFPYLNGEELNNNPEQLSSRFVISFWDWPLDRSGEGCWSLADDSQRRTWLKSGSAPHDYPSPVASDYPDCLDIVKRLVRPERQRVKDDGTFVLRNPLPQRWWHYADKRPALYSGLKGQDHALVKALSGKHNAFARLSSTSIFDQTNFVFLYCAWKEFAVLNSSIHECWWRYWGADLGGTTDRYNNRDCFETFAFPSWDGQLDGIGESYHEYRRCIMLELQEGLTKTYNRFNNPIDTISSIVELRRLHVEMDQTVAAAYGWQDFDLGHGFHETRQGIRYTISEFARREVLDRLLKLNQQRHTEEEVERAAQSAKTHVTRGRKPKGSDDQITLDL